MSDQGQVPDRGDGGFGLIETLLWTRRDGFWLLPEHLARLSRSCRELSFPYGEAHVLVALNDAVAGAGADRLRVRLVATRAGILETTVAEIAPTPADAIWTVVVADPRFRSDEPMLRHKTTRRALYEDALANAQAEQGADEVLFLNERGEICEAARCNVFLAGKDGVLLTPPLTSGLLPGTLRARLLAEGRARESALKPDDLQGGELYLGNSVRGLVRAELRGG